MAGNKFFLSSIVGVLLFSAVIASDYLQSDDVLEGNRDGNLRSLDSLGGGHILRDLNENSLGTRFRRILYGNAPQDFLRTNRGLDSLKGATFGTAKRLDSLTGFGFGTQKRNLDEIDRTNFGRFAKRNLDEIDRSDFDRFVKKRDTLSQQTKH